MRVCWTAEWKCLLRLSNYRGHQQENGLIQRLFQEPRSPEEFLYLLFSGVLSRNHVLEYCHSMSSKTEQPPRSHCGPGEVYTQG